MGHVAVDFALRVERALAEIDLEISDRSVMRAVDKLLARR